MAALSGIYRAKATKKVGATIQAFVPQVFGDTVVIIRDFVGIAPTVGTMGWVSFQGGNCEFPVWHGDIDQTTADARYVNVTGDAMSDTLTIRKITSGVNFVSNKTGTHNIDGAVHMSIQSSGTEIGRITRATATTAGFLTSSDEDLKENLVPVDDELAYLWMRTITPYWFNYKGKPDVRHTGYSAQRIANEWPNGVSNGIVIPGHGDVEDRTWNEDGEETTPREVWEAWMMDHGKITPILHAGWQAVDRTVEDLKALVAAQAAQIAVLQEEVVDLHQDVAQLRTDVWYTRRFAASWNYVVATTAPPASGTIRTSADNTMLWVHKIDGDGYDRGSQFTMLSAGVQINIRGTNGKTFNVLSNAPPIDSGTYYTIPITVLSGSVDKTPVEVTMRTGIWAADTAP